MECLFENKHQLIFILCVLIILFHGFSGEHLIVYVYHLSTAASETIPTW